MLQKIHYVDEKTRPCDAVRVFSPGMLLSNKKKKSSITMIYGEVTDGSRLTTSKKKIITYNRTSFVTEHREAKQCIHIMGMWCVCPHLTSYDPHGSLVGVEGGLYSSYPHPFRWFFLIFTHLSASITFSLPYFSPLLPRSVCHSLSLFLSPSVISSVTSTLHTASITLHPCTSPHPPFHRHLHPSPFIHYHIPGQLFHLYIIIPC